MTNPSTDPVRAELIALFEKHRGLFLLTTRGLTDEQARLTPTASELSLGGLVKHVASTTDSWLDFIETGPDDGGSEWGSDTEESIKAFRAGFQLQPGETLAGATERWDAVHGRTVELVRTVDLDQTHPLPAAPWFAPDEAWSNRRVFIHLIAELAQHAGHADILRETIDGQKSMG